MAEELTKMWATFSLSEEEEGEVDIQATDCREVFTRGQACVVGKLVADRYVSKETIKTDLQQWWRPTGTLIFKVLGENLFLIEFEKGRDKKRVPEGRPWVFEANLFLVEDFDGRTSPTSFTFDRASFWVRMFNLPLGCMGREVGRKIGSSMGIVEEVDTEGDGVGWGEYLRVKISLDLSKPLPRGRKMNLEGTSSLIVFQYERLPKFCFLCGVINHGQEGCSKRSEMRNQSNPNQFGPWMRAASPPRRAERNRGVNVPRLGKAHPDPPVPEGGYRRGAGGARRGDDRKWSERGSGGDTQSEKLFRESPISNRHKRESSDRGYAASVNSNARR